MISFQTPENSDIMPQNLKNKNNTETMKSKLEKSMETIQQKSARNIRDRRCNSEQ